MLAQALLSGGRRREGLRAVVDGLARRARAGGSGRGRAEPHVTVPLRRDPGLWLLLHLRPPGDRRGDDAAAAPCAAPRRGSCATPGSSRTSSAAAWPESFRRAREHALRGMRLSRASDCSPRRCCASTRTARRRSPSSSRRTASAPCASPRSTPPGACTPFLARFPRSRTSSTRRRTCRRSRGRTGVRPRAHLRDARARAGSRMPRPREIRRVLRPGGRHVFTVPVDPRLAATALAAGLPPQHHGRGWRPVRARDAQGRPARPLGFRADVPQLLRDAGFEPETHFDGVEAVFCGTAV